MISIITPVWNRGDLTYNFLAKNHLQYHKTPGLEWIIVDNGSTDNTGRILATFQSTFNHRLVVVRNAENLGFPVACNQGAARAIGETLIFLNNDVIIGGDYAGLIEQELKAKPGALVGAQLLNFDTGWNVFGDVIVPYLAGWCLACSSKTFGDMGGFDERYSPCDYEDMDFSFAATWRGHDLVKMTLPLRHISGQSGQQMPERRAITERNRVKFAEKWGLAVPV